MRGLETVLWINILLGTAALLDITTPSESLYRIILSSGNGICLSQSSIAICSQISSAEGVKECKETDDSGCLQLKLLVSFSLYHNDSLVHSLLSRQIQTSSIDQIRVEDVNECTDGITICSDHAICRNSRGAYRCQCMVGYVQPSSLTSAEGTYCVESCDFIKCYNGGICNAAVDEGSSALCRCSSGYEGRYCEITMDTWKVIAIGISAGIAALVGLVLFIYAMTRLLCYKLRSDDDDETRSQLSDYKPRGLADASRFSDFGSFSRANSGYQDVDNGKDMRNILTRNDGLILGRRPWDASSDISDPTPTIVPEYQAPYMVRGKAAGRVLSATSGYLNAVPSRANRAESVTSDPDYFA